MHKKQQGFILIDSLVGIVVLSVALLGFAALFIQTTKGTATTNNQTKAAYIANEQLSKLKIYDGQQQDRNSAAWVTTKTLAAEANHGTIFSVTTNVITEVEVPADLHADTIPVRATVSWNEPMGPRQLQIITYYYYGAR